MEAIVESFSSRLFLSSAVGETWAGREGFVFIADRAGSQDQKIQRRNKMEMKTFADLKQKAKGGFFRSKNHMLFYIKSNNLLKEGVENE